MYPLMGWPAAQGVRERLPLTPSAALVITSRFLAQYDHTQDAVPSPHGQAETVAPALPPGAAISTLPMPKFVKYAVASGFPVGVVGPTDVTQITCGASQ